MSGGNFCYTSSALSTLAEDIEETFKTYGEDYAGTTIPLLVPTVVERLRKLEPLVNALDKLIGGDIGIDTCISCFETINNGDN